MWREDKETTVRSKEGEMGTKRKRRIKKATVCTFKERIVLSSKALRDCCTVCKNNQVNTVISLLN